MLMSGLVAQLLTVGSRANGFEDRKILRQMRVWQRIVYSCCRRVVAGGFLGVSESRMGMVVLACGAGASRLIGCGS
jgi:hypothetical protein